MADADAANERMVPPPWAVPPLWVAAALQPFQLFPVSALSNLADTTSVGSTTASTG